MNHTDKLVSPPRPAPLQRVVVRDATLFLPPALYNDAAFIADLHRYPAARYAAKNILAFFPHCGRPGDWRSERALIARFPSVLKNWRDLYAFSGRATKLLNETLDAMSGEWENLHYLRFYRLRRAVTEPLPLRLLIAALREFFHKAPPWSTSRPRGKILSRRRGACKDPSTYFSLRRIHRMNAAAIEAAIAEYFAKGDVNYNRPMKNCRLDAQDNAQDGLVWIDFLTYLRGGRVCATNEYTFDLNSFSLASGHRVSLVEFHVRPTYANVLGGFPTMAINERHVKRTATEVRKRWGGKHDGTLIASENLDLTFLPAFEFSAYLDRRGCPLGQEQDYRRALVYWFDDCLPRNFLAYCEGKLLNVDWEKLAH
ncbi:MAG: hypothetical protein JSR44_16630 [Spirochaetes bacterium]|nr:hypothetical protein [Spirochaetota bacterium]